MGEHTRPRMLRWQIGKLVQTMEFYYEEHAQRIYRMCLHNGYKVEAVGFDRLLPAEAV